MVYASPYCILCRIIGILTFLELVDKGHVQLLEISGSYPTKELSPSDAVYKQCLFSEHLPSVALFRKYVSRGLPISEISQSS